MSENQERKKSGLKLAILIIAIAMVSLLAGSLFGREMFAKLGLPFFKEQTKKYCYVTVEVKGKGVCLLEEGFAVESGLIKVAKGSLVKLAFRAEEGWYLEKLEVNDSAVKVPELAKSYTLAVKVAANTTIRAVFAEWPKVKVTCKVYGAGAVYVNGLEATNKTVEVPFNASVMLLAVSGKDYYLEKIVLNGRSLGNESKALTFKATNDTRVEVWFGTAAGKVYLILRVEGFGKVFVESGGRVLAEVNMTDEVCLEFVKGSRVKFLFVPLGNYTLCRIYVNGRVYKSFPGGTGNYTMTLTLNDTTAVTAVFDLKALCFWTEKVGTRVNPDPSGRGRCERWIYRETCIEYYGEPRWEEYAPQNLLLVLPFTWRKLKLLIISETSVDKEWYWDKYTKRYRLWRNHVGIMFVIYEKRGDKFVPLYPAVIGYPYRLKIIITLYRSSLSSDPHITYTVLEGKLKYFVCALFPDEAETDPKYLKAIRFYEEACGANAYYHMKIYILEAKP